MAAEEVVATHALLRVVVPWAHTPETTERALGVVVGAEDGRLLHVHAGELQRRDVGRSPWRQALHAGEDHGHASSSRGLQLLSQASRHASRHDLWVLWLRPEETLERESEQCARSDGPAERPRRLARARHAANNYSITLVEYSPLLYKSALDVFRTESCHDGYFLPTLFGEVMPARRFLKTKRNNADAFSTWRVLTPPAACTERVPLTLRAPQSVDRAHCSAA